MYYGGGGGYESSNITTQNQEETCKNKQLCSQNLQNSQNKQDGGNTNSIRTHKVHINLSRYKQIKGLTILCFFILFLAVAVVMWGTYSALQDSKSARGTIAFDFKSPALCFDSGLQMYYCNVNESGNLIDGTLTYGNNSSLGASSIVPYKVSLNSENQLQSYYIKIEYEFLGLDTNVITFDNSLYSFGTISLGSMIKNTTENNKFYIKSTERVPTGASTSFDILSPLNKLKYVGGLITTTTNVFKITISADSRQEFSDSQAHATLIGTMGMHITESTVDNVSALNSLAVTYKYINEGYSESVVNTEDVSINIDKPAQYTKIVLHSNTPVYVNDPNPIIKNDSVNGWDYTLLTDASGTNITAINSNYLNLSKGVINVSKILSDLPTGTFLSNQDEVPFSFNIMYSTNDIDYATMKITNTQTIANATIKVTLKNKNKPVLTVDGELKMNLDTKMAEWGEGCSVYTSNICCNLSFSSSIYLKIEANMYTENVNKPTGQTTFDGITYNYNAVKTSDNYYYNWEYTIISQTEVENVNLTKLLIDIYNQSDYYISFNSGGKYEDKTVALYYSLNGVEYTAFENTIPCHFNVYYSCVPGDTEILVGYKGETKLAQELTVGDKVLTMDMQTKEYSLQTIKRVSVLTTYSLATIKLKDGTVLRITPNHPILLQSGEWAICGASTANDVSPDVLRDSPLRAGDIVKTQNGYVEVVSVDIIEISEGLTVYSYEIENNHNFFADGILVHNEPCVDGKL